MSDTKLKPCPFCGGEAIIDREDIFCSNCYLSMRIDSRMHNGDAETYKEARAQAIEEWNTRKPIDRIVESLNKEINGQAYLFNEVKRRGNANQMAIHEYARQCYEKAVDTVKDGVKNE